MLCSHSLPDACERVRRQPRLEEDVSDFRAGHQAVHVAVCLAEEVVILCLVCWRHHPLQSRPKEKHLVQGFLNKTHAMRHSAATAYLGTTFGILVLLKDTLNKPIGNHFLMVWLKLSGSH